MQTEVDEGVRFVTSSKNMAKKILEANHSVKNSASMVLKDVELKQQ